MNRRSFLRVLGLSLAAVAIPVKAKQGPRGFRIVREYSSSIFPDIDRGWVSVQWIDPQRGLRIHGRVSSDPMGPDGDKKIGQIISEILSGELDEV